MKILMHLFIGFTVIKLDVSNLKSLFNLTNKYKIKLLSVKVKDEYAFLRIYSKDEKVLKNLIDFTVEKRIGIPALLNRYSHRVGLLLGAALFFVILYISPLFIWDIEISGTQEIKYETVEKLLHDSGVKIGAFLPKIERSTVYSNILLGCKEISWVSVNVIGSTAFVEIVEREYTSALTDNCNGANIVASKDGIIVDADVKKGRRIANDGAVVKKNEILVSGVYDTGRMGTRFVQSDAKVFAIVNDTYTTSVPLEISQKEYGEEVVKNKTLKILGNYINIFKNSTQIASKYDTITREDGFPVLLFERLPITVTKECVLPYDEVTVCLSEGEALLRARNEIEADILNEEYVEIFSTEENFFIENNVLYLDCTVEAVQNIALVSEFMLD